MNFALDEWGLRLNSDWMTASNRSFRPPSFPPPREWCVCEDSDGDIQSRWGDEFWDLSLWAGEPCRLYFGDGPASDRRGQIDPANADMLRLMTTWRIWGPRASTSISTMHNNFFLPIRKIVALCSHEGILASELFRFPKVLEQVPRLLPSSSYEATIAELHHLWDAREQIGFVLVDAEGLKRLAAAQPGHCKEQTAYIPPRIWTYQVNRLREFLDDYLAHQRQIEDCFNFCVEAYAHNCGSLKAAVTSKCPSGRLPFGNAKAKNAGLRTGCQFHGAFHLTAERFGVLGLLERWVETPGKVMDLRQLSAYLTLVQYVGAAYITCFTLQRIKETASLRVDCLHWEDDPKFGRVPIICGETTKTDPDSDARWPTSPSVELAVAAMSSVSRLRMRCAAAHPLIRPTDTEQANPYLLDRAFEPWAGGKAEKYSVRRYPLSYAEVIANYPRLLDLDNMRITEEDLRVARMLTPTLRENKGFVVGEVWPMAWHQLRRTGAVNMFSSGLLSDSSIQFQMKHSSRLMPLYYGRGYTKLHLNEEVEGVVITAMYAAMAQSILTAMGDRFISPYSSDQKLAIIVNLVGDKDAKALASAAKRGEIFFRETRLGACTKRGTCSYGGIESVARCSGGDGYKPCIDVLYDRTKAQAAQKELIKIDEELARAPVGTPRYKALLVERKGLENFLDAIRH